MRQVIAIKSPISPGIFIVSVIATRSLRCSICIRSHRFPVFTINLTFQTRSWISFARRHQSSPFVAPSLRIN
jgi:expansin (peptidoglycan-binding protein)